MPLRPSRGHRPARLTPRTRIAAALLAGALAGLVPATPRAGPPPPLPSDALRDTPSDIPGKPSGRIRAEGRHDLRTDARVAPPRQACHAVTARTCAIARALGRGVNLGNVLDAPREGDWGLRLEPALLDAAAPFRTVRLPVRWSNHAAPGADATLDEDFARRVDQAVDRLLAEGRFVILDLHHYTQLTGGTLHPREFPVEPQVLEARLVNLWRQIALRYRDRPDRLLFELLNEPHDAMAGERWNRLAARALAAVRESNPTRVVMIGPDDWNHPRGLHRLRLPRDRRLIVAIHSYDPFDFTHQAVPWRTPPLPGGRTCCEPAQRAQVAQALDTAMAWNRNHGVPMHLGEFGAYRAGDLASRVAYARLVREEAERRGLGWAWWELASDFSGVWDPATGRWVEPLRRALLEADGPSAPVDTLSQPPKALQPSR